MYNYLQFSDHTTLVMQDPTLKVEKVESPVITLPFTIPECGAPTTYYKLPTPSGEPCKVVPEDHSAPIEGGFASFLNPAKDHPPEIYFILLCVAAGGKEVAATLSASYVITFSITLSLHFLSLYMFTSLLFWGFVSGFLLSCYII